MRAVLYLAWRHLARHKLERAVVLAALALVAWLPAGLRALVRAGEAELGARAAATPILIGRAGSPLELALRALHFRGEVPAPLRYEELERVEQGGLAAAIPLHARFEAQGAPIVGTTLAYYELRGLRVENGRQMTRLGDCVLGARVARERGLGPGARVVSSPERAFDPTATPPLAMRVTGVLAPSGTADDGAVFVDLRTAWLIEGLAHGHAEIGADERIAALDGHAVAGEAVQRHQEVTAETAASFHFHGDAAARPITALIALPRDEKAAALLLGRYAAPDAAAMALRPREVVAELFATVAGVQGYVELALALAAAATLAVVALVFALSTRLRRRELETMARIGASRGRVAAVVAAELAGLLAAALALAATMTWLTARLGPELVRRVL